MRNPVELRKKAADKVKLAKELQAKIEGEDREFTDEEQSQFDAYLDDSPKLLAEAERIEKLEQLDQQTTAVQPRAQANPARTADLPDDVPLDPSLRDPEEGRYRAGVPASARDHKEEGRCGYRVFGEFLTSVMDFYNPNVAKKDDRLYAASRLYAATGMQQKIGSEGGFLAPPTFSSELFDRLMATADNLLEGTDQFTIDGESITFPAVDETSRATGSRWGGIQGFWTAEGQLITKSRPKPRQLRLEPHELAVLVALTNKLLRNSAIALEQFVSRAAIDEINFLVGNAIVRGTGAGQPAGILGSGSLITVAKETGQAADTFTEANVAKMWARLHPSTRARAVWLLNVDVDPQLMLMVTEVKNVAGTDNVGGFNARLYNPDNDTLMGRPIRRIEYASTLGDLGDVILWDPLGYAVALRSGGIEQAASIHVLFQTAESMFRFMFEVDGRPWLEQAITPFQGANTLSTHVTLAARA